MFRQLFPAGFCQTAIWGQEGLIPSTQYNSTDNSCSMDAGLGASLVLLDITMQIRERPFHFQGGCGSFIVKQIVQTLINTEATVRF